jgi:hypothetical protein
MGGLNIKHLSFNKNYQPLSFLKKYLLIKKAAIKAAFFLLMF